MVDLGRRGFLKLVGLTGTTLAFGCSPQYGRKLIPYIAPPEDVIPGKATWYASTCRECPAGCGLLAKNRDGHVIKVEGNPLHPVSQGRLCARGQASVQGLYNPDRRRGPARRDGRGTLTPVSWEEGEAQLAGSIRQILEQGRGDRIVLVTDLMTGTLRELVDHWLAELGAARPLIHEPFAYEPLRKANEIVFGVNDIPGYHIDQADFLISFGANIVETWISNVYYGRSLAAFHTPRETVKPSFVYVGPRLSATAANADQWISVPPGTEYLLAAGMLKVILEENAAGSLPAKQQNVLRESLAAVSLAEITARTGVAEQPIRALARRYAQAEKPLAIAEGLGITGPNALSAAVAANLLCTVVPASRDLLDFSSPSSFREVSAAAEMKELVERTRHGKVELLLIHNANPLYFLPPSWELRQAFERVPLVVSFTSAGDETGELAHLVLPTHTPLESWGDYAPRQNVTGLLQPVMGPMFDSRHLGDILISVGRKVAGPERFPWEDFYHVLRLAWRKKGEGLAPGKPPETFWQEALMRGGFWEDYQAEPPPPTPPVTPRRGGEPDVSAVAHLDGTDLPLTLPARGGELNEPFFLESTASPPGQGILTVASTPVRPAPRFVFSLPDIPPRPDDKAVLFTAFPTVQFFDGRGANRPWLQEMPEPIAMTTWGSWLEIHPQTANVLGVARGDLVTVRSPHGSVQIPVLPLPSVPHGVAAMPLGQGHSRFGRFAEAPYGHPMQLMPAQIDPETGGMLHPAFTVTLEKLEHTLRIAHTDGSLTQQHRGFAQAMSWEDFQQAVAAHHKPHLYLPLPEGYHPDRDFYPAHDHADYRWGMVIDLDRCIGCGACAVACYAENNVAVVGKQQVIKGREMSWLRIQRYFEADQPLVRFLPMLCQHCDNAPCESVCPVYAPHHGREGLNNQVYNRCIGTRFCSQNCPYKVRRFNWFTFTHPEPLTWQLNPDVTVRQKGVMEKCSFCIQRIAEAKLHAKAEGRKVRDGEFTTACAQTCPADAIIFGSLMDPESRVSKLIENERAYQVLDHLNTKPAVIYLKRLTQPVLA